MTLYRSLINNVIELFEHRRLGCGLVIANGSKPKRATKLRIDSAIVANDVAALWIRSTLCVPDATMAHKVFAELTSS